MFSIILPMYNSETTISRVILSVTNQTLTNWELIIWDDCSNDNSFSIAQNHAKDDHRIRVGRNEINRGVGETRNKALSLCKYPWVSFIDSDDIWDKTKLARTKFDIKNNPNDSCFYHDYLDYKTKKLISGPAQVSHKHLKYYNPVGCFTVTVKRSLLGSDPFDSMRKRQDWQLWYSLSREGYMFRKSPGVLGEYGLLDTGKNISSNKFEMLLINYRIFLIRGYGRMNSLYAIAVFLKMQLLKRVK